MYRLKRRYRLTLWTAFPLLLVTTPATLALLFANSGYFHSTLQRELARLLPGDTVAFRTLQIRPDLSVLVRNAVVRHPETREVLVTVKEIRARIASDPRELAAGRIAFDDIYVADADVFLEFDEQGNLSLLDAFVERGPPEDDAASDVHLTLANVRVVRSTCRLSTPGFGLDVRGVDVPSLDLTVRGPELAMDGDVSLAGGRFQTAGADAEAPPVAVEFHAATLKGLHWKEDVLRFDEADILLPGGRVTVAGALDLSKEELPVKVSGRVAASADMPVLAPFLRGLLAGQVEVRGELQGPLLAPTGTFRVTSPELTLALPPEPFTVTGLAVLGRVERNALQVDEAGFQALGGAVRVAGRIAPADGDYAIDVQAAGIATGPVLDRAQAPPAARPYLLGRADVALKATGRGLPPDAVALDLDTSITLDRAGGATPIRLPRRIAVAAQGRLEGHHLTLRKARIAGGGVAIAGEGGIDLGGGTVALELDAAVGPLAEVLGPLLPPDVALDGRAHLTGAVTGPFLNPQIDGRLALHGFRILDLLSGETLDGALSVKDGTVAWTGVDARTALGRLGFDARVELWDGDLTHIRPDPPLEVSSGRIAGLPIRRFLPADVALDGRLDGTFRIAGSASDPRIEAHAASGAMFAYGERIERVSVQASYAGGVVEVPTFEVVLDRGRTVTGGVRTKLGADFSGHLRGAGLPLEAMRHLTDAAPDLRGELSFDLAAEGEVAAPRVQGVVQLKNIAWADRKLGDAFLNVGNGDDGAIHVRSQNVFRHFALEARVPVDGTAPEATVRFDGVPLKRFAPELAALGVSGVVGGEARGGLDAQGAPWARASVDTVRLKWSGLEATNVDGEGRAVPWVVAYADGRVDVGAARLQLGASEVEARGWFDPRDGTLEADVRGYADAALAHRASGEVARAEGGLSLEVRAAGALPDPEVTGRVTVARPVTLALRALSGRVLAIEQGQVELTPAALRIPGSAPLRGKLDDGLFSASGEVGLDAFRPTDATLRLDATQIEWREPRYGLKVLANAEVAVEGHHLAEPRRQVVVSGLVDVVEGEVRTRSDRLDLRAWADARQEVQEGTAEPSPWLSAIQFREFKVVGRDSFKVDSQVNNLEFTLDVQPQLNVEGAASRPLIQGSVQVHEDISVIRYSGRVFEVTRGIVDFDQNGNPVLDFQADARIVPKGPLKDPARPAEGREERSEHQVTIVVKGPIDLARRRFDRLEVRFESPQGLSEGDIVILMAFGMLREDMQEESGGGAAAGDIFVAPLLRGFEDVVKATTGDVFGKLALAPNLQSGGVVVSVGTELLEGHVTVDATANAALAGQEPGGASVTARVKVTDQLWFDVRGNRTADETETEGAIRYRLAIPVD